MKNYREGRALRKSELNTCTTRKTPNKDTRPQTGLTHGLRETAPLVPAVPLEETTKIAREMNHPVSQTPASTPKALNTWRTTTFLLFRLLFFRQMHTVSFTGMSRALNR